MALKPKVAEVIKYRIPDWVAEKEQFLKFIEYYYEWIEQKGKPLEFLRNIVEYTDIDNTDDEFVDLIINKILTFVPVDIQIDRALLVKNVKAFIKAKGTDDSLNFIMKAVFDEEAYRVDMSDHVLRTSDNKYNQDGFIAIQVTDPINNDFSGCIGSKLVQTSTNASVKIKNVMWHGLPDGRMFWVIEFDPRFKNCEFNVSASVKAMKSNSDPTFIEITDYQSVLAVSSNSIRLLSNKPITFYEELKVMNLDRTFIAEYESTTQTFESSNGYDYDIKVKNATGTLTVGETIYFLSPSDVDSHLNARNYAHGTVGVLVNGIQVGNTGSGYYNGMPVEFTGGSGSGVEATIGNVTSGGVNDIVIVNGGTGYQIGDKISIADTSSGGYGFEAQVSDIDGTDAILKPTMELDSIVIESGGNGYSVGDQFIITGLKNKLATQVKLSVSSVATESTPTIESFKIFNSGRNYSTMKPVLVESADVSIVNNKLTISAPLTVISGLVIDPYTTPQGNVINVSPLNYADSIVDLSIRETPAPNVNLTSAILAYNGFGATLNPTISGGEITNVTVTNAGYNYVSPIVTVSSATGRGAVIKLTKNLNGEITGTTIVSKGSGYTTATLTVSDAAGEGFIARAINSTAVTGAITGMTININGEFDELPSYSENVPYATTSAGVGAKISLLYKIKSIVIENTGHDYIKGPFTVSSVGGIGTGLSLLPVIENNQLQNVIIQDPGYDFTSGCTISFDNRKNINWSSDGVLTLIELANHGFSVGAEVYIAFSGGPTSGYYNVHSIVDADTFKIELITSGSSTGVLGGYGANANLNVVDGKVVDIDFISSGTGYTADTFFYTINTDASTATQYPADISVTTTGDGSVLSCEVINSGYGYSTVSGATRVVIDGSYTTPATLQPTVFTGVDILTVESAGDVAFSVDLTQPWQYVKDNTGKQQVVLYQSAVITDTGFGTGAVLSYYITNQGKLAKHSTGEPWVWISSHGASYDLPAVTIGTGSNKPIIRLGSSRKIEKVNVVTAGSEYNQYATAHVIGTGQGAQLKIALNGVGGISSATVLSTINTNKGYINIPKLTVNDESGIGKISAIQIKSPGEGFWKFPKLECEFFRIDVDGNLVGPDLVRTTPAVGARLLAVSNSIGGVKELNFKTFGYGYEEVPSVTYPLVAVMNTVRGFKINEDVSHTGLGESNIGLYLYSDFDNGKGITANGTSTVIMDLTHSPRSLSIYPGQKITLVNDSFKFEDDIKGREFIVTATNEYEMNITLEYTSTINSGLYVALAALAATDIKLSRKAAKIVGIDEVRNTLYLSNVDDVFGYSEEVNFIAESDGSIPDSEGRNFDGYTLATESASNISMAETIVGHKSGTVGQILWFNRADSLVKTGSIGLGTPYFDSRRGLVSEARMRTINSKEVQDFSYQVHTGLSPNYYSDILKNTVHPAGYYLSGVVEDVTEILDQLKVSLPLSDAARTQDNVYLTILAALGSLYFTKNISNYSASKQYSNRFDLSNESVGFNGSTIEDYDLWNYPALTKWHENAESDQRDYTIWPSTTKTAELEYHTIKTSSGYSQSSTTLSVTSIAHGLKTGDSIQFLNATHYNNRGDFFEVENVSYSIGDMVRDSDYKYYKCISGYTTAASPTLPRLNVVNWELCEGNLNSMVLTVTVADADTFLCTMSYEFSFSDNTTKYYQKMSSAYVTATYERLSNVRYVNVTTTEPHGLIASINSWIYVYIPHATEHQYIPSYCQVVDVISSTEFVIDSCVLPLNNSSGTIYYILPNQIPKRMSNQITLNDVEYEISGANVIINGLPETHTLSVGNLLYVAWGTENYYVTIDSTTQTSVTFEDPGITGTLNISFTLNQADPAQPGYNSLFEHWF